MAAKLQKNETNGPSCGGEETATPNKTGARKRNLAPDGTKFYKFLFLYFPCELFIHAAILRMELLKREREV